MQDEPHPPEILRAVAAFLRDAVVPVSGATLAFQARVAAAALDLVRRQLELAPLSDAAETARLHALFGAEAQNHDTAWLTAELSRRLGTGEWDLSTPGVAAQLWHTAAEKLAIDQPYYAAAHPQAPAPARAPAPAPAKESP